MRKVRALINTANLLLELQGYAVLVAVYIYNRSPHTTLKGETLYKVLYNKNLSYNEIKIFSSIIYTK